jgi:hypothetical protein
MPLLVPPSANTVDNPWWNFSQEVGGNLLDRAALKTPIRLEQVCIAPPSRGSRLEDDV